MMKNWKEHLLFLVLVGDSSFFVRRVLFGRRSPSMTCFLFVLFFEVKGCVINWIASPAVSTSFG